jgi:hypothetical protein
MRRADRSFGSCKIYWQRLSAERNAGLTGMHQLQFFPTVEHRHLGSNRCSKRRWNDSGNAGIHVLGVRVSWPWMHAELRGWCGCGCKDLRNSDSDASIAAAVI